MKKMILMIQIFLNIFFFTNLRQLTRLLNIKNIFKKLKTTCIF